MPNVRFHERNFEASQLLPREAYVSLDWFELEQERLFSRYWNFAGTVHELANPGDYVTVQAGRYPLFVVVGSDGEVRAFHNICRHRGTQFMEGCGSTKHLMCPYHRWTYNLDGSLRAISQENRLFRDPPKDELGLMKASIGNFRGVIFVHPDPEPEEDFKDFVANLDEKVGEHHPDQMVFAGKMEWEFEANWKLVGENYMDAYHLYHIHEQTSAVMNHDKFEWDTAGRHFLFYQPTKDKPGKGRYSGAGLPRVPGTKEKDPKFGGYFHKLFPNFGWVGSAVDFSIFLIKPVAHDLSIVETRQFYMPMEEEKLEELRARRRRRRGDESEEQSSRPIRLADFEGHPLESHNLMVEDMWVCRQMQKGMNSPAYNVGPLAWKYEATMTFYQNNIYDFVPGRPPLKAVAG